MTLVKGSFDQLLKPGLMKDFGYSDKEIKEFARRNREYDDRRPPTDWPPKPEKWWKK